MKAKASTMTMKILRKVSMTLLAINQTPRHTSQWTLVHLDAGSLPHYVAWNVGCWQFLFTNGLDFAAADLDESSGATTDSASWLGNAAGDQFAATLLILSPFWSQPCRLEGIAA
jgi:hypothetical protein